MIIPIDPKEKAKELVEKYSQIMPLADATNEPLHEPT